MTTPVFKSIRGRQQRSTTKIELSCAKEMMVEIAGKFGGRLPFDIIASDALMANAPFMELIEALGAAGIFIFKQENRKFFKQAKSDFCGKSLGFILQEKVLFRLTQNNPSYRLISNIGTAI